MVQSFPLVFVIRLADYLTELVSFWHQKPDKIQIQFTKTINRWSHLVLLSLKERHLLYKTSMFCFLCAHVYINRQSSVKTPPMKNTSSNNTLHIFIPFYLMCPPLSFDHCNIEINYGKHISRYAHILIL